MKKLLLILFTVVAFTSCGLAKLPSQVEVGEIESLELKGLTAVELAVGIKNDSKFDLKMENAVVDLYADAKHLMTLTQIGECVAPANTDGAVKTLWRIGGIDPLTLLGYSGRLLNRDFEGMTFDYTADMKADKLKKNFSGKGADLTKFMAIFARKR